MAAVHFSRSGAHALRDKPLQLGMHRAVFRGHDVPARLRLPSGPFNLLVEEVGHRHHLRRPDQLLFLLGQLSRETAVAVRPPPDATARDIDGTEYVRPWNLIL